MKQILQNLGTGKTSIVECPVPELKANSLKIATSHSLISSGTERMLVDFGTSSLIDKARKQPDKVKQVISKIQTDGLFSTFEAISSKMSQPIPLGYSNVGVVQEVSKDLDGFKPGDRVVSNGAHADVVVVKENLCTLVPPSVTDEQAAFTVVGSIALQGVRLAKPTLGEAFVVIGTGLIGLLTIQLLIANGCRVMAIDFDPKKLELARKFGAITIDASKEADTLSFAEEFSRGRGIDGVIITASTDSNEPIKTAANICRKRARIILVGVVGLDINREDFYEKEITFQVSCSYGPGRYDHSYEELSQDYPIGFVRWTEKRNFEAFLDLLSTGQIDTDSLISSRFLFEHGEDAYRELLSNPSSLGILLDYKSEVSARLIDSIKLNQHFSVTKEPSVGIIGAGNYASRILIPAIKKTGVKLHTLITENGLSGNIQGKKHGFDMASTDFAKVLGEDQIDTVFIATRHDSHASLVMECLKHNKNVWVEKPLAINLEELEQIKLTYEEIRSTTKNGPQLMVGFNRRFSPHAMKIKDLLSNINSSKSILVTVNAGYLPKDHWTQDPKIGGGRIIGEACHHIDLVRYFVGKKIVKVTSESAEESGSLVTDRSTISLKFEDGSLATILYLSNGAPNYPKERIEIFTEGKILQLDNFRKMKGFGWKNFKKMNLFKQNKGQLACTLAFIQGLQAGKPPIASEEIFDVSEASILASER